jgi:hypothetical protein
VNSVAQTGEKNRMRHRRVIPFLGKMKFLHPEWYVFAARCGVAATPGRNDSFWE